MAVYAIFGGAPADIDARVSVFPTRYQLTPGQWLVSYEASLPTDVYQTMKNVSGDFKCVVVPMTLYYGWHDKAVWDWVTGASRGAV